MSEETKTAVAPQSTAAMSAREIESMARRVLPTRPVVKEPKSIGGVQVTSINWSDSKGQPFFWKKNGELSLDDNGNPRPYGICNFNLCTGYGEEQAKALFHEGKFQDALNTNMSFNINESTSLKASKSRRGTVVVDWAMNKDNIKILVVKAFYPDEVESVSALKTIDLEAVTEQKPVTIGS